jgi:ribulose-5-phosphate 4-epimerase/fuculose-1-phosphate aldolase
VAVVLEQLAAMALETIALNPAAEPISEAQLNKHYFRKHGPKATYGQA